jgi:hypothetical protein
MVVSPVAAGAAVHGETIASGARRGCAPAHRGSYESLRLDARPILKFGDITPNLFDLIKGNYEYPVSQEAHDLLVVHSPDFDTVKLAFLYNDQALCSGASLRDCGPKTDSKAKKKRKDIRKVFRRNGIKFFE